MNEIVSVIGILIKLDLSFSTYFDNTLQRATTRGFKKCDPVFVVGLWSVSLDLGKYFIQESFCGVIQVGKRQILMEVNEHIHILLYQYKMPSLRIIFSVALFEKVLFFLKVINTFTITLIHK